MMTQDEREEEQGIARLPPAHEGRRRTDCVDHLAGTNPRVRRAFAAVFGGAVGKETVRPSLVRGEHRLVTSARPLAGQRTDQAID